MDVSLEASGHHNGSGIPDVSILVLVDVSLEGENTAKVHVEEPVSILVLVDVSLEGIAMRRAL